MVTDNNIFIVALSLTSSLQATQPARGVLVVADGSRERSTPRRANTRVRRARVPTAVAPGDGRGDGERSRRGFKP